MPDSEATISPTRQETSNPETNRIDRLDKLFYLAGQVTRKSMADKREGIERSLQLRAKRAQILKEVRQTPDDSETRRQLFQEAKTRDELEKQYLNQGDVTVDLPGLGPQSAHYTIIELPQDLKPKDTPEQPPIFFIPGLSNDLDCLSSTIEELAYNGRRVIAVGFPESFMGKVTPEFAKAAKESVDFEPHVTFFKEAVNKLLGGEGDIELWSHSAGGPVIEQMLHDPAFQKRTTNAVLLNPAASADIAKHQAAVAFLKEGRHLLHRLGQFPRYVFTGGARDGEPEGQRELKDQVFKGLADRVLRKSNFIEGAKVKEGGKIIVLTGTHDTVTRSHEAKDMFTANPQVTFIDDPEGYHFTAVTAPEKTIATVNQHLHPTAPTAH